MELLVRGTEYTKMYRLLNESQHIQLTQTLEN